MSIDPPRQHTRYLPDNVLDAARARIARMFDDCGYVYVAFSGGKDSGVLLNLVREEAMRRQRRYGILHIDYEAQYQATTSYVAETLATLRNEADIYHVCLPVAAPCATSMHQSYWTPWNKEEQHLWVRDMPTGCIHIDNAPEWFYPGMSDYETQERMGDWIASRVGADTVCCMVGIRAQESLHRWRTIAGAARVQMHANLTWTRTTGQHTVNAYPIYDWQTEDIWTANAHFGWRYNSLYDLFYQAGVPIDKMRVASPFISQGVESLHLYRAIEPHTWGKLVSRVNGVNFAGIYGGTKAMGWKTIEKPDHFTWRQYMEFLLSTLPQQTADNYRSKLATSIKFWREKGGVLSEEAITDLRASGIQFEVGAATNYKTDKLPVRMEYADTIDSDAFSLIPTYKRMCVCILKNDHLCKYMGFTLTKQENERRKAALEKYAAL